MLLNLDTLEKQEICWFTSTTACTSPNIIYSIDCSTNDKKFPFDICPLHPLHTGHTKFKISLLAQAKCCQLHVTVDIDIHPTILLFLSTAMLFLCLIVHTTASMWDMTGNLYPCQFSRSHRKGHSTCCIGWWPCRIVYNCRPVCKVQHCFKILRAWCQWFS